MKKTIVCLLLIIVVIGSAFGVCLNISEGYFLSNVGLETKVKKVNLGFNVASMFPNCVVWEVLYSESLSKGELWELCEVAIKNFGIEAYASYDVLNINNRVFWDIQGRVSLFHLADEHVSFFTMLSLGTKLSIMNKANTDGFTAEMVCPLMVTDYEYVGFTLNKEGLEVLPSLIGIFLKIGYKHNF